MVQEYYVKKLREITELRKKQRDSIKTKNDALKLVNSVRKKILNIFGPFPKRTPLNSRTVETVMRDQYVIEKVVFESRPSFPVTANLYLPKNIKGKCPAVLALCGHYEIGKAGITYQSISQGFVKQGYAVLIIDPAGQGERHQFVSEKNDSLCPKGCCREHNMIGNQQLLIGDFFGSWRSWDAIRALDYLLERPEVDKTHIGLTGTSGGGTMSSYINALESRITMAAPSCFITTYLKNLENELPADAEQIPPYIIKAGLDMADFIIARAPRPTILVAQDNDFFDIRGTKESFDEACRIYSLLGKKDNIKLHVGKGGHDYPKPNREEIYKFFSKQAGMPLIKEEPEFIIEQEQALYCTKGGQVTSCKIVSDFTKENAENIRNKRKKKNNKEIKKLIQTMLNISRTNTVPNYRVLRPKNQMDVLKCVISRFAIETEPGIQGILHVINRSPEAYFDIPKENKITVYLPHLSTIEDIEQKLTDKFIPDEMFFSYDFRGIGESLPVTCNMDDFFSPYGSNYFYASTGLMLGEQFLGRKIYDVLSLILLLKKKGYKEINLAGRGLGSIVAAFAGFVSDDINEITLINALLSYHECTQTTICKWPVSHFVYNVLNYFDLPDIYKNLSNKNLKITDPWNCRMELWDKGFCAKHTNSIGIDSGLIRFTS